ncbi:hypothetical protein HPB51_003234 [Rhipicephalus microplus]|uniref:MADF domain-containing protein n=1 Tax=Rhipicephalus microplus TaxID=6941 RepID=A0A9J6EFF8_RHIMP|nr:hypothetical protein HPB51_003234 [Rhipicephalus microplus]
MEVDWRQLQTSVIDEVEKYPCVYNSNLISRWNAHSRAPYWGAVPTAVKGCISFIKALENTVNDQIRPSGTVFEVDVTEADCRRVWKGLRGRYVREIQLKSTRDVDSMVLPTRSQWPFLRRLDFLRQHIRPKRQIRFSNYIKITRSIGAVSQGEEADSVNNNESTSNDVLARGFSLYDMKYAGATANTEVDGATTNADAPHHAAQNCSAFKNCEPPTEDSKQRLLAPQRTALTN